jgi:hypothetical protein
VVSQKKYLDSTASYQSKDLKRIGLDGNDLIGGRVAVADGTDPGASPAPF